LGAALSGATTAAAAVTRDEDESGAPLGPTSAFGDGMATTREGRAAVEEGCGADDEEEDDVADATIVAERCARIAFAAAGMAAQREK